MTIEQAERILGEPSPKLSQTQLMGIYFDPEALIRPFDLWRHRETKAVNLICATGCCTADQQRGDCMSSARSPRIWWEMASNWFQMKFEGVLEFCRVPPPGFGQTSKTKTPTVVTLSIPTDLFKSIGQTHPAPPLAHDMLDPRRPLMRPTEPSRILLEMDIRALEEIRDTANAILAFDHEEWIRNQPYLEEPSALARRMTMDEIVAYRDKMAREYIGRGKPAPREVEEWWPR